jgi:hypothetical protein
MRHTVGVVAVRSCRAAKRCQRKFFPSSWWNVCPAYKRCRRQGNSPTGGVRMQVGDNGKKVGTTFLPETEATTRAAPPRWAVQNCRTFEFVLVGKRREEQLVQLTTWVPLPPNFLAGSKGVEQYRRPRSGAITLSRIREREWEKTATSELRRTARIRGSVSSFQWSMRHPSHFSSKGGVPLHARSHPPSLDRRARSPVTVGIDLFPQWEESRAAARKGTDVCASEQVGGRRLPF